MSNRRKLNGDGNEPPRHLVILHQAIVKALHAQDSYETAIAAASRLDRGDYRIMTRHTLDPETWEADLDTLVYSVEIGSDEAGWQVLLVAPWHELGVTREQAAAEALYTQMQHGHGIPDDIGDLAP